MSSLDNKSWKECKLGDILEEVIDNRGRNPEEYTDFGIPVIDNFMIKNQKYINLAESKRFLDDETFKSFIRKHIQNKDVLITLVGNGYGNISQAPKSKAVIIQNTIGLRCNGEADNDFLFYCLKFNNEEILNFDRGAVQPSIKVGDLKSLEISLPPIEEQKAIAEVLSSLDDKIDLLHRQNQTLESLAQTLFRQWFIEEAKEEWEEKPLGKITNIAIGRTPPRKEDEWFSTDFKDVKWISIKDLGNDGVFIFKTSEYLTQEAVERFNVPVIPKDTVVLSFKMTVGRVAITTETMLSNEAIAHFKFHDKTPISKEYLYLFLKTFPYDSLGSTSSIVTAINSAMIKEMMVLIPDEKIMKEFSSIVEPQFEKIRQNQQQIQTLENLRDTLLPKLLSGEVRVKI